ncbi:hypothetical protein E3N88_34992 [Mikania micrantha]|uniref:F-box domain-containing protein n=1 Tax=Mikania micrantha TaxID=192012 RepID=A0A5N6M041_9ASTR|nr:hypothetical protein E3N88_34992 [Mikania micrantha]
MSENKHNKRQEIEHTNDMIGSISKLPDCILHHILSFLPTIEVVQTSILSKRWKNLWASVPSLDLDDFIIYASEVDFQHSPDSITSFLNFEERILRSQDEPKIEKFILSCHICFNPSRVGSWISNAVVHNVREVDLCLFSVDPSTIPPSIYDCKSLVILKIEMLRDIEIPSSIYLPCLKILDLSLVAFPNDESTQNLFSSCPVLEELVLWNCAYGMNNLTISSLSLKKLTINDQMDYHRMHPNGCKIKIDAKNLTYLDYIGHLTNEIFLNNVSSLVKACIHIPILHQREKELACRAVDLLKGLQNVVFLSVSNCTMMCLIYADRMNPFPVFPNLIHLVVTTEIVNYTFRTFMYLLNFCPALQFVSLSEGFNSCMLLDENDSSLLFVPICISHHLKSLVFKNFHANDSEIWFLKFVLKNACVLEKMDVWWCKPEPPDPKKQRDVRKELEITEKSSAGCICWY